jgi:hypothetical protein
MRVTPSSVDSIFWLSGLSEPADPEILLTVRVAMANCVVTQPVKPSIATNKTMHTNFMRGLST